ncbi:hypothetical protein [Metamycoplasma gateae]|uniref:Uncharacterized protein n=1 Tax=Metamycoplasma gateae TaxID=35769 RepID=A0ABZ2AK93_9BACT|nr:hypothetical protein V2E26_00240 [Metamycoplasma gateae]
MSILRQLKDYPKSKKAYVAYWFIISIIILIPIAITALWITFFTLNAITNSFKTGNYPLYFGIISAILLTVWVSLFFIIKYIVKKHFAKIYKITKNKKINNKIKCWLGNKFYQADINLINDQFEENNKNFRI